MKKRTFKEETALLKRGFKYYCKNFTKIFWWDIIKAVYSQIIPYFTLFMSSLVVNELVYSRDIKRLLTLAAIAVAGIFINDLIKQAMNIYEKTINPIWAEYHIVNAMTEMDFEYKYTESSDIMLKKHTVDQRSNYNGAGIKRLGIFSSCISDIASIITSVAITVNMFKTVENLQLGGFLAVVNSPWAIVIMILLILSNAYVSAKTNNKRISAAMKGYEKGTYINVLFGELNLLGEDDVRIFNMQRLINNISAKALVNPSHLKEAEIKEIQYDSISILWKNIVTIALFIFVSAKAFIGTFGIGNFLLYRGTVAEFIDSIGNLATNISLLFGNNDALEDYLDYVGLPNEMYKGSLTVEKRTDLKYEIEFKNVSFKYPGTENYVLRNVNARFNIGERLAIVGMNGSGKSTFIKLLCRLYDPTEGEITLNGIDIKKYNYDEYLKIFSVVFQDYKYYAYSIGMNVACEHDYDSERVMTALDKAGLKEKVEGLENGLETNITKKYSNDGVEFSGGELQKLVIARALYKGSPFIILDEPTAALDPLAEQEVYEQFNKIMDDKTAIFISHRLSSCRFCDRILVFDSGSIVQEGTHKLLVDIQDGKYYELWHAQAQYYTN